MIPTSSAAAPPQTLRILAVGDVIGAPGRRTLRRLLPAIRAEVGADLVIANGENSAGGRGVSRRTAREMRDTGVDVITTGNHVWAQQDVDEALAEDDLRLLRPLNYPLGLPGNASCTVRVKGVNLTVVCLMGRVFMTPLDDPFAAMDHYLTEHNPSSSARPVIFVDFHAEATSEKVAMGWHLAGRVAAVFGTHTHVPTSDTRVLPGETGYVTDLGMVGPRDSIIGTAIGPSLERFTTGRPRRLPVPDGPTIFNSVVFEIDPAVGTCRTVQRFDREDHVRL